MSILIVCLGCVVVIGAWATARVMARRSMYDRLRDKQAQEHAMREVNEGGYR